MCDIAFKNVQGRAWKVNRTSAYAEAGRPKGSLTFMREAVII